MDDDPIVRDLVADAIAEAGFQVDTWATALKRWKKMQTKLTIL